MLSRNPLDPLDPLTQPIVEDTWREKYRYGDELNWAATCARVVDALCKNESDEFVAEALRAMAAREVVPAGRILAGAGTDKRVVWINCFVSDDIQDSMRTEPDHPGFGIMDALSRAAYTQQMGGGIGMNFSTIRPRGAVVHRTGSVSSGVLPFMDMWDAMCATIRSSGSRRGAQMAVLGIWHPDIEEFVEAKQRVGRLTNFNVSVLVPDAFMQALEKDEVWDLHFPSPRADGGRGWSNEGGSGRLIDLDPPSYVYKVVRARELWDKIIGATYVHAEPGVIFIDRVNQQNNLSYCETITAANPCGEQMLPAAGCCNLGHTNLAVMVDRPFELDAEFRFDKLEAAAGIMVRLLDNVLDETQWPTEEQTEEARAKRRVGLGFTGLATALQQLGIPYGSNRAVEFTRTVAREQAAAAYSASVELARSRGAFPLFEGEKFLRAPFVGKLSNRLQSAIKEHGIRNGVLLSVAPTGTTSLVMGNVSSGVEPVFAHRYRRKVRGDSGEMENEYSVYDYGYLKYCEKGQIDPGVYALELHRRFLPPGFVTADQLTVEQHLQMAAAAQEWVDSAISKTINCPTSMSIDEFRGVYARAYSLGMKGCTTYRPDPRSKRGAVMEAGVLPPPQQLAASRESDHDVDAARSAQPEQGRSNQPNMTDVAEPRSAPPSTDEVLAIVQDKIPMQDVVDGRRYRIKWPSEDCAYYVIITDCRDAGGCRRPFELFISTKSERHSEWVRAFALLVTAIFRREGDPTFVVDELRSVFSAAGGTWVKVPWADKPKLAPSLVAAIGLKIEEHLRWLGMIASDEPSMVKQESGVGVVEKVIMPAAELLDACVHCGARAVVYSEGCATCYACGRSDCG